MTPETRERLEQVLEEQFALCGFRLKTATMRILTDAIAPIIDEMVGAWLPIETAPRSANLNDRIFWLAWSPLYPDCPVVMNAGIYWPAVERERQGRQPAHLQFEHWTHWRPLPQPPEGV